MSCLKSAGAARPTEHFGWSVMHLHADSPNSYSMKFRKQKMETRKVVYLVILLGWILFSVFCLALQVSEWKEAVLELCPTLGEGCGHDHRNPGAIFSHTVLQGMLKKMAYFGLDILFFYVKESVQPLHTQHVFPSVECVKGFLETPALGQMSGFVMASLTVKSATSNHVVSNPKCTIDAHTI